MALIDLPIVDLGNVPLVYDTVTGVIKQSEEWVAKYAPSFKPNTYGPGDVFRSATGRLVYYPEALEMGRSQLRPAATPQAPAPAAPPPSDTGTGGELGKQAGAAAETTLDQIIKFLKRPIWPDDPKSLPTGFVLLGAVLAFRLVGGRRR